MKDEVTMVRKAEVIELLGISEWTLAEWVEKQNFPKPIFINDGAPARWRLAQVKRWLDSRERRRRKVVRRGCLA
jgi:predicted DNA-binding transcriptional regulator AlpA